MGDPWPHLERAQGLERKGDLRAALDAYGEAFEISGRDPLHALDIGRLALKLDQPQAAEQVLRIHLAAHPSSLAGTLHLAQALRDQQRYGEAMAILMPAIQTHPGEARLWTQLGVVLTQEGRPEDAWTFLDEAVRLDPYDGAALYHRANALSDLGEHTRAIADYAAALRAVPAEDRDRVRVPLALSRLATGDLELGWEDYRSRLSPRSGKAVRFAFDAPQVAFAPKDVISGMNLLLVAEQGLGDEVMFAAVVPEVLRALGKTGHLTLAVEPRLVSLFRRSFPKASVVPHRTHVDAGVTVRTADTPRHIDGWAPMAAPLRRYGRFVSDFPALPYLRPDPGSVAHWRAMLASKPGRKIGLLWKSLKLDGERHRQFAAFDDWEGVLTTPGVTFVNLQYGDCEAELRAARDRFGVEVWQPPGLDLKTDLDEVTALCRALDLVIGFSNATFNLAGACGAPSWLICGTGAWTQLGTDRYPWYPQARVFNARRDGWRPALDAVGAALRV
jgi:tetratricopeptide (TPR) repeat protein